MKLKKGRYILLHNLVDAFRSSDVCLLDTRFSLVGAVVVALSTVLETISNVAKVEVYILKNVFLSGACC